MLLFIYSFDAASCCLILCIMNDDNDNKHKTENLARNFISYHLVPEFIDIFCLV